MLIEFTKLALGLALMLFHRSVADYVMERERELVILVRQRGIPFPAALSTETARNVYFGLGAFVALFEVARIWMLLRSTL